jgi:tight adherence protein C
MQYLAIVAGVLAFMTLFLGLGNSQKTDLSARLSPRAKLRTKTKELTRFKPLEALLEIPDFASLLWFAVSAGESLEQALKIAVNKSSGYVSAEFERVLINVEHGALLQIELQNLAAQAKSEQVRELATKLAVALNNGSALTELLSDFVQSSTATVRTELLAKAGKNETKMMIPMVFVILPVTVMFALYPSLALIQGSFL